MIVLNNLSLVYLKLGDYAKAIEVCERAKTIISHQYGPDSRMHTIITTKLARFYHAVGQSQKALDLLDSLPIWAPINVAENATDAKMARILGMKVKVIS